MLAREQIHDPNVAAFYAFICNWPVVVCHPAPIAMSPWGRLFTCWVTWPPLVGADECRRVGPRTLYVGEKFSERMELYRVSHRCEARERRQASRESSTPSR